MSHVPTGRQPVGSECVFQVQQNAEGSIERYKARIVAKSYSQMEDLDDDETFAPVTRYNSLRLIMSLATDLGLETDLRGMKSVFLNGDLVEEIWMIPPPGIGLNVKILRLDKALYSHKQAPPMWFETLSEALAQIGFISRACDPCVFISEKHKIIVLVYVDDITTAGSRSDINRLIGQLRSRFKVTGNGSLKYILGIEIKHRPEGMERSPQQSITNILSRLGMENCLPVSTPMDTKTSLVKV